MPDTITNTEKRALSRFVGGNKWCLKLPLVLLLLLHSAFVQAESSAFVQPLEKVTVQLRYLHQFQFAGFYAAIAQGYYREVGLEVELKEAALVGESIDEVLLGNAQYGQTESDLLFYRLHGKPVVALAPIFQHSPLVLMVLKDSGIRTPHDLKGKRVMLEMNDKATSFIAMLIHEGVGLNQIEVVEQSYGVDELISGQVDAVGVYLTNRPFLLQQAGIEYRIINPLTYGIDFYGDTLYTTEQEIARHPQRVERFLSATLRGWQYALSHKEEIIDLIIAKYGVKKSKEHLRFEADAISKLIMPELIEIGHTNPQRWQRMADIFVRQKMAPNGSELNGFIYQSYLPWLKKYPVEYILVGVVVIIIPLLGAIHFWYLNRRMKEQMRARKLAETDNQRLGEILEHSLNEIYIFDSETLKFIQVNEGARVNLGYSMDELKQLTPLDLKPEYDEAKFKRLTQLLKSGLGQVVFDTVHKRKDGSLYPVEVNLQFHDDLEQPVFYAVINDISERKASEDKINRLNHLYATLSQINQAIVKIDNEKELFQSICRITVEFGRVQMAWIGVRNDDNRITPVVSVGEYKSYVEQLKITLHPDDPLAQGPTAQAYLSGQIIASNDFPNDQTTEPWHELARLSQWGSSCAVPILRGGETYAVLNVYTSESNYFDQEIIRLFDEMKEDLSFALDSYDREMARRQAEENLKLSDKVFQQSQDAILICDQNNSIISINPAFTEITGYSEKEALGKNPGFLSSGRHDREFYSEMWQAILENGYWQGEIWNRRKNGELFPEWLTISVVSDDNGAITNYIAIFSDISLHKESEERIEHLAHYDPVTDLPNRILLRAHVDHELIVSERQNKSFALLFMDLDHFKNINDSLGHTIGDQVLIKVSERLKQILREEDTVARLGGDEFNILLSEANFKGAALVAAKIINTIARPIHIDHYQLHITASIGISLYPENGQDYETLSKNADTALYQSKHKGRNQFAFFTEEMQQATMRRMEIEHDLRLALKRRELQVYYQPQVDAKSGEIIGAEALLRWLHPQWGMVPPVEFIPVAEECGLILTIGDWVLDRAVAQAAQWQNAGLGELVIAVNLSMAQFKEDVLYQTVKTTLKRHQFAPEYLELELTESIAMKNAKAALEITRQLRQLGVQLSIDDFGTGYSSLSYLKAFSLDKLKIDRSFTKNMTVNKDSEIIVDSIIGLAKSLGLRTIAEGVETAEQWRMLRQKDCDELQGYYLNKPLTAEEFEELLVNEKRYRVQV
ncbi:EAL domain-containing protein [Methylomarinum vadi]|uniref:EAL domain-containing protein n=1 Tax=Methylomarinum vadi TaxID=438855 RepID=UPI000A02BD68|nr:EAL domain-containing protein [Methylomarinum vadi]